MNQNNIPSWAPHGKALLSYWHGNHEAAIGIKMKGEKTIEMPMEIYFRSEEEMPNIEQYALEFCQGKVLDVGAGAGAHCLLLQENGLEVTGLDIVPEAVHIMKKRGVEETICVDFLKLEKQEQYNTLLFLMNGIGIAGSLEGLTNYLQHAHELCRDDGQILLDSSALDLPEKQESNSYYGEISYQLSFEQFEGEAYQWLYVDPLTLHNIAVQNNWNCQIIYEEGDGSYLARLTKSDSINN